MRWQRVQAFFSDKRTDWLSPSVKSLDELAKIARYFSDAFPFENLDVLQKNAEKITPQFLCEKMLIRRRGGLCYEINAFLHLFLQALGYNAVLVKGTVFTETGWATDGTHVLNVVKLHEKCFVLDNSFGSSITRKPLEIGGAPVDAPAGAFRAVQRKSEKGTHGYEKLEQSEWKLKYAFDLHQVAWEELDRIKKVITESDASACNRQLIVSQCLQNETYSINGSRLRVKRPENEAMDTPFHTKKDLLRAIHERANASIYAEAKNILSLMDENP